MKRYFILIGLFLLTSATVAYAVRFKVSMADPEEFYLRVGSIGTIDTVTHTVPLANIGDGTLIQGVPAIEIECYFRRANVLLVVFTRYSITASVTGSLTNGAYSIPFSSISWISRDGDIPDGTFPASGDMVIYERRSTRRGIRDLLTFYYSNDVVVPSGTYTGTITYYTASVP